MKSVLKQLRVSSQKSSASSSETKTNYEKLTTFILKTPGVKNKSGKKILNTKLKSYVNVYWARKSKLLIEKGSEGKAN